jgi:MFS family permease
MFDGKSYRWWVVAMLWFVCLFNYADRQAIFSVFPLLKAELGLSDVQLGIVGASFMWVYALIGPMAGWLGDRLSRKTLIVGGLIFWSVVTAATALCNTYWQLVLVRALGGFGEAFYFPASMSLISDYHGKDTRSRAMSFHQSSVYAGTIAGGAVSGLFGQYYGWRSSFVVFGALGVVLGLVLVGLLREPRRGQAEEGRSPMIGAAASGSRGVGADLRDIFKNRMVFVLVTVFIGANFVAMIFLSWMPSFLFRKFNMSLSMAGLNSTVYLQVASVLGVLSGGLLADALVRRHRGGRMITQAMGLFGGVLFCFLTGWTMSVLVIVAAMAGFGYFKGLYDANIWASLYDVVDVKKRAVAVGLMNSLGWLGGGFAPVAIGAASERFGMSACISATSVVYLMSGLLLAWGILHYMRSEAPRQARA